MFISIRIKTHFSLFLSLSLSLSPPSLSPITLRDGSCSPNTRTTSPLTSSPFIVSRPPDLYRGTSLITNRPPPRTLQ
ncbi:hypothetical protein T484DRAFT_1936938 [Baffinella frigidus]|nr:hypothetical protein T484DRAFT_1936938 [Cryptophyta sp. CCMP2293]